jgi:GntR family transcriptional regulator
MGAEKAVSQDNKKSISLRIDHSNPKPLHAQVRDLLRELIENRYFADREIITEKYLQDQLRVSRNTIRQAVSKLADEGLLRRERSRGIILDRQSSNIIKETKNGLSFTEAARKSGQEASCQVISVKKVDAPLTVSNALSIGENEKVFVVKRLRFLDEKPVCISTSYLPVAIVPDLSEDDFATSGDQQSIFFVLESIHNIRIKFWVESLQAILIPKEAAKLLGTRVGDPGLFKKDIIYSYDQRNVMYTETLTNFKYPQQGIVFRRERIKP